MPRHPQPTVIARQLRQLADTLERPTRRCSHRGDCRPDCPRPAPAGQAAADMAEQLAARGWPNSTLGDGTHGTAESTSTERAALSPDQWADADHTLATLMRRLWATTTAAQSLCDRLLAHAPDDDPIPAGRGHCEACERLCIGDGNDRLRSGFCHPCMEAWRRWRVHHPDGMRSDYIRWRRQSLKPSLAS